jgi:lambda family phage portal protein
MRELPPPNWLDRAISFISPGRGLRRQAARIMAAAAYPRYRGAETSRLRSDWALSLTQPTPEFWDLDRLRERSRDLNRSDPVASGATETMALNIVGQGLRPQSGLRAEVLDIAEPEAQKLRRQAETLFDLWMPWADNSNRHHFQDLQFLALRKVVEDGEVLALPTWSDESWRPLSRTLELIEGDRLAPPFGNISKAPYGIELGDRLEPQKYWIRKASAKWYAQAADEYIGIPARDGRGRPLVLHIFPARRPGQLRGVPYFAPVLTYFKDLADYLEAEVVAARVAACLAVFITRGDPYGGMLQAASGQEAGTGDRLQGIEPGLISYLNIGEDIKTVDPKRGGETFAGFMEQMLRIIGTCLGLPYELLMKDFSKTNYSSARAALLEGRRMFSNWRAWLARRFCQPIWELLLEEAYLRNLFPARNFYENRAEYCRARWVGGSWGWVDPVKEVASSKMAEDFAYSTLADECAAQGRDWEEVLEQKKREQDRAKQLGITIPQGMATKTASDGSGQKIEGNLLETVALLDKLSVS